MSDSPLDHCCFETDGMFNPILGYELSGVLFNRDRWREGTSINHAAGGMLVIKHVFYILKKGKCKCNRIVFTKPKPQNEIENFCFFSDFCEGN